MKKKMYRERYSENLVKVETFEKPIENPKFEFKAEEKPKKTRKKKGDK